jgi:hypothetical protein
LGAKDADVDGMDGVHFVPLFDGSIQPLLWLSLFPADIQRRLVSFANPGDDINTSGLALTTSVFQHDVPAQLFDMREAIIYNSSDNVATLWL